MGIYMSMLETFAALAEPTRSRSVELLRQDRPVHDIGGRSGALDELVEELARKGRSNGRTTRTRT
jgi:hypothetical protein